MGLWYYLEKGKPKGPVTADEIIRLVKGGSLGLRDLVYPEGGLKWAELQNSAEFRSLKDLAAQKSNHPKESKADPQWVLLTKKPDGSGYKQKGPFATEDLKKMLARGEIVKSDYVWREGFKEWYKILALPDFFEEKPAPVENKLPPLPEITQIVAKPKVIVHSKPVEKAKPDDDDLLFENPTTASGKAAQENKTELVDDIFEKTANIPMPEEDEPIVQVAPVVKVAPAAKVTAPTKVFPPQQKQEFSDEEKTDILTQKIRFVRRGKSRKKKNDAPVSVTRLDFFTWFWGLPILKQIAMTSVVVISVFTLTYGINYYLGKPENRMVQLKAPKLPTLTFGQKDEDFKKPTPAPPEEKVDKVTQVVNEAKPLLDQALAVVKPKPPVEEKNKGTFIRFNVAGNGSDNPILTIQTDASSHYAVQLEVRADPGYSLNSKSFQRIFTLKKLADREVDLVKKGVPPGIFTVIAKVDEQEWKGSLRLGTQNPDFNKKLRAYRKLLAFDHMDERYNFIKVSSRIESSAWKLVQAMDSVKTPGQWRDFYKGWKTDFDRIKSNYLKNVKMKNRNSYVHGWRWMELIDLRSRFQLAAMKANSEMLKKAAKKSTAPREIAQSLQKIKEAMLQQGLFDKIE